MTITVLPTAPVETDSRAIFSSRVAALMTALPTFITETNAVAVQASADAATAAAAANSLATVKWVSGTAYADGDVRWCPTTRTSFRRIGAGAGTTVPSADPTNWKAQVSLSNVWCGTATGTANALTLTPAIPSLAYVAGDTYLFKASASPNSAATTVAISGLAAVAIQIAGGACVGGEILASKWYSLTFDTTTTAQLSPVNAAAAGGLATQAFAASTITATTVVAALTGTATGNAALAGSAAQDFAAKSLSVANGIAFPATVNSIADVNTLDDYEEGSWTPSIGGTATYTTQEGRYVKIGKLVFVHCDICINVIGTGSTITISGLPFAAEFKASGEISNWQSLSNPYSLLLPAVAASGTTIEFNGAAVSASSIATTRPVFASSARITFSISYRTA